MTDLAIRNGREAVSRCFLSFPLAFKPAFNAFLAWLALGLFSGCSTTPNYGNFAAKQSAAAQQSLAAETTEQLAALYPPAKTQWLLQYPLDDDPFSVALLHHLREAGYAVQEFSADSRKKAADTAMIENTLAALAAPVPVNVVDFAYRLDAIEESPALYRLHLSLGEKNLNRAYRLQDERFVPVGFWVYGE